MNKCILCTFLSMIWNGLRDNTCPSVDKKKQEKKTPTLRVIGELISIFIIGTILAALLLFIGYSIFFLIAWLLGTTISVVIEWFLLLIVLPIFLIM